MRVSLFCSQSIHFSHNWYFKFTGIRHHLQFAVINPFKILRKKDPNWDFIVLLKHPYVPCSDIIIFYWTTIRPVLEYFGPVFHHVLWQYFTEDIKRVQKRIFSITCLQVLYSECLVRFGVTALHARHLALCHKLLNPIMSCPRHKLLPLLP